ncbi:MAG TPA: peptide chain release factor N(5)-glutamine methyltransferase [Candidatus Omnitrophota bacterium]|nr:peptide chain release factor N(5)-glutamine methyltransferase [Candidatus Omnitrophota bacterium]
MTEEEQMLMEVLKCRRVDLYLEKRGLTDEQKQLFEQMQSRRIHGEPLQYIIGHADFMGFKLFVDARVLIPRPETELMVESAVDIMNKMYGGKTLTVLDLGTGSGNIAIALAKHFPDCLITALDISRDALDVARRNAHFHRVFERIKFSNEDMSYFLQQPLKEEQKFDLVISNPPYIPTDYLSRLPKEVQKEPWLALEGGEDGLDYVRYLLAFTPNVMRESGKLIFEIWDGQSELVYKLNEYFRRFRHIEFGRDYVKTNRFAICVLKSIHPFTFEEFTTN